jgi:hypothetical protein
MITASEYRDLPLESLAESANNPRRRFDETALNELADFVPGHKIGFLFRRPFCGRTSRMALGSERSAFRATHNGSAERKRNRGIRVRESEECRRVNIVPSLKDIDDNEPADRGDISDSSWLAGSAVASNTTGFQALQHRPDAVTDTQLGENARYVVLTVPSEASRVSPISRLL